MVINFNDYIKKLRSCFTGKAVGGTLGMPMEGYIGTKKITYYDPVPTAMIANDDLDLQVVWAEVIGERGLPINRRDLADGWLNHMRGLPDEYGVVMRNLKNGLYPPLSGSFDNKFYSGMGSAIRSEIWAALAPGDPKLAADLASEDSCCDHYGDGIDSERFLAALESTAYTESEPKKLIECALGYVTRGGRLENMLRDTMLWYDECGDPLAVREKLLHKYYAQNWTDIGINLSYIVIGWLDGENETQPEDKISRALCTAVGLGNDGDCTGATLGSILGIIYPDRFEERWTKPLGGDLVLSGCITSMHEVKTIDDFCVQLAGMCADILDYYGSDTRLSEIPPHKKLKHWAVSPERVALGGLNYDRRESLVSLRPYTLRLFYPDSVTFAPNESGIFHVVISNPSGAALDGEVGISASEGWTVSPERFKLSGECAEIEFTVTAPPERNRRTARSDLYFEFKSGVFGFSVQAGLLECYPMLHVQTEYSGDECPPDALFANAEAVYAHAHFFDIPDGGQLYSFEVRSPMIVSEAIMVAQTPRPVKVWQDGVLILSHDGSECCPAFHRIENVARIVLNGDWSRFVIAVSGECDRSVNYTPLNAYARVDGCPSHFDIRKEYDSAFGKYEKGELVVGFAQRSGYEWLHELEWRIK